MYIVIEEVYCHSTKKFSCDLKPYFLDLFAVIPILVYILLSVKCLY